MVYDAHLFFVACDQFERVGARLGRHETCPYLMRDAVHFVVEDITQALGEDQRQDVVLVLRRVLRAADGAGCIPQPLFDRFVGRLVGVVGHSLLRQ